MKAPILTAEMIADFKAKGGKVERCKTGASSGITKREWDARVRGETPPVEIVAIAKAPTSLRLRAGHGAI